MYQQSFPALAGSCISVFCLDIGKRIEKEEGRVDKLTKYWENNLSKV